MASEKQIELYKKLVKEVGIPEELAVFAALENGSASDRIEELIVAAQDKRAKKTKKSVSKSSDSNGSQLGSCVKIIASKLAIIPQSNDDWIMFKKDVIALYNAVNDIKAGINNSGSD